MAEALTAPLFEMRGVGRRFGATVALDAVDFAVAAGEICALVGQNGAGTYANNKTVAISGTGWGEYFIRLVMAKTISDMMEFGKMKLNVAADEMIMKRLPALGGDGGLIAVDRDGNIAMPFCTEGMYRGYIKEAGTPVVKIYK